MLKACLLTASLCTMPGKTKRSSKQCSKGPQPNQDVDFSWLLLQCHMKQQNCPTTSWCNFRFLFPSTKEKISGGRVGEAVGAVESLAPAKQEALQYFCSCGILRMFGQQTVSVNSGGLTAQLGLGCLFDSRTSFKYGGDALAVSLLLSFNLIWNNKGKVAE